MIVVVNASDAPWRFIKIHIDNGTWSVFFRFQITLLFLKFGHFIIFLKNSLQFQTWCFILCLDLLEVQIFNFFSRQKEIVLILTIKPDWELSLANAELVFGLHDTFKDLCQVLWLLKCFLEVRLFRWNSWTSFFNRTIVDYSRLNSFGMSWINKLHFDILLFLCKCAILSKRYCIWRHSCWACCFLTINNILFNFNFVIDNVFIAKTTTIITTMTTTTMTTLTFKTKIPKFLRAKWWVGKILMFWWLPTARLVVGPTTRLFLILVTKCHLLLLLFIHFTIFAKVVMMMILMMMIQVSIFVIVILRQGTYRS